MAETGQQISPTKLQAWWLASRPKTLPAAMMPVIIGSAMAYDHGQFLLGPALAALICALLIQVATNFSNDLVDFQTGSDTGERLGPARAVASKWISESEMFYGTLLTLLLTVPFGLYLIYKAGFVVLVIGLVSILAGIAYTAGPYPLAYNGLGDIFVFIFFGLVATAGTYYVQATSINWYVILGAIPAGALTTNLLVVNNYRDIDTDRKTGKRTLATILGKRGTKVEFVLLLILSYVIPFILYSLYKSSFIILLPLLSLPLAARLVWQLFSGFTGKALNKTLAHTARFALIYGILFSLGIVL